MFWRSLVCAIVAFCFMGCASASYYKGEGNREVRHASTLGQALAYVCNGVTIAGPSEELLTKLSEAALAAEADVEDVLEQVSFSQLPQSSGLCVVAKSGSISDEVETIMKAWLWSVGVSAIGDVVNNITEAGRQLGHSAIK